MGYIEQRKLDIFWSDEGPSRLFSVQARLNVDYQLSRTIGAFASVGYGDTRYYRTPYDTNFVSRPEGRLTLKVRMNQTGNSFHAKGTVNGVHSKADLKTSHKTTFSIAAIYRGIGGGYGYNWVLGHRWLLHFSMLPTFVVYNRNSMTVNGVRRKAQHMRFNMNSSPIKLGQNRPKQTLNHLISS